VWTTNTLSLNPWVGEAHISIRLKNGYTPERNMDNRYGEDLCFEQDAIIIQKYKKFTKKRELAKLKTWTGDLGNKERPGGLKTWKGGPGKS